MRLIVQESEQLERNFKLEDRIVIGRKFVGDKMELNVEFLSFHLVHKTHVRQLEFDRLHF